MVERIVWAPIAVAQKEHIYAYWNKRNKSSRYSQKIESTLDEIFSLLLKNPSLGKLSIYRNTRVITLGHFQVFYRVSNTEIQILSFWDSRRDPSKLEI